MPIRIIGIDPGTRVVGFGVLDMNGSELALVDVGVISVSARVPLPDRLVAIHEGLTGVINRHRPQHSAVEDLYAGRSARSAITTGEGRGVALLALAQAGLPVEAIPPARIKKALTNNGNARKAQVADMVARILGLPEPPESEDASDALAAAIALAFHLRAATA